MENLRAAALMVASMLFFAIEDMFVKWLSGDLSVGLILAILGLGGGLVFATTAKARGDQIISRALLTRPVILRNIGEMMGTMGFVMAIALTPLASATAILQAIPLAVTLGAALFMGASVGWRRWLAIVVGFLGVLLVIRPGFDAFEPASLFAVQGVIGLAIRDLATRACPKDVSSMQLSAYGFLSIVPVGIAMMAISGTGTIPSAVHIGSIIGALIAGVTGYYMIVATMRIGDVAVVTPFRYTRLVFALIVGAVVFGEKPDTLTLVGAAIIVASGLYTLMREARLGHQARKMRAASLSRP